MEVVLLVVILLLPGALFVVLRRRTSQRRGEALRAARARQEVSAEGMRAALGKDARDLEYTMLQAFAEELPQIRTRAVSDLNRLAGERLKVTSVRTSRRGRSHVHLEGGWRVDLHGEGFIVLTVMGLMRQGPVVLSGAHSTPQNVIVRFTGGKSVEVESPLVHVVRNP